MFHSNLADRLYKNGEASNNQFNTCECFSFGIAHERLWYFKRGWRGYGLIALKACEDTLMFLGNWIE